MRFRIDEQEHARDITVIRLEGDIDSSAFPELHRRLSAVNGRRRIVVDLSGLEYIDPSVLGWLVTTVIQLRPRSGGLVVVCPDPAKRQIFELVGLDRVFPIVATLDGALHELDRG